MNSLSSVSFLLLSTVVFHLFSSAAAGMIRGGSLAADTKSYCLPKPGTSNDELLRNIDIACNQGADCGPIDTGGTCAQPSDARSYASFAMNSYFRLKGSVESACDFEGTGLITANDPSHGECKYA
ncbi:hypothetical protein HRI_002381800 [Hibiscus trionum]|uniref:X8 domain-containing protein n=1 Tax=Hibiscus trionum TaxID=183268 RepID=A0A9W7M665_HIBTR|nr:hypothetical protein HRI_002381800 [Hibiscus trionum]